MAGQAGHAPAASEYATIAEVAEHLKVSTKTVRRYIASGAIRAERVGPRLIRIDLASVESLGRPLSWAASAR